MDYAEYEREIDEESVKSNQSWDEYFRAQRDREGPCAMAVVMADGRLEHRLLRNREARPGP